MADTTTRAAANVINAQNFRQRTLADFATSFDEWLIRAEAAFAKPTVKWSGRATLGELLAGGSVDSNAIHAQGDSVYELAELCRKFVTREMIAWAFQERRGGSTVEDTIRLSADRVRQTADAVHDRKWSVGLRAIDGGPLRKSRTGGQTHANGPESVDAIGSGSVWDLYADSLGVYERLEGSELARSTWAVIVEDSLPDFLEEVLAPALRNHESVTAIEHAETIITDLSQRAQMTPVDFLETLRRRQDSPSTAEAETPQVTEAIIAWRSKTVKMFRHRRGLNAAGFARHIGIDQTVVSAIIREDQRKFKDWARELLLTTLGITREEWYAHRD